MAHYIMALLGQNDPASEMFSRMGGEGGRLGDYVFNQEGSWQSRRLVYHFPDAVFQRWIKLLRSLWRIRMPTDPYLRPRRSSMI